MTDFQIPRDLPRAAVYTLDGDSIKCSFESYWCADRSSLAGGFDEHHEWPKSMGGPDESSDVQHMLVLCPTHHRRQHALIRAMVEHGSTSVRTVRYYSATEKAAAAYAVSQWVAAGKPKIGGWTSPAAAVKLV